MKRDFAGNDGTTVCERNHDDNPEIPSEKVVIDGQRTQGTEHQK